MKSLSYDPTDQRQHLKSVASYYDHTWLDYRLLWLNDVNHAIHFGYDDGVRRSHSESLMVMNRILAEGAAVKSGERVLDAGCGVAGSGIWLAENKGVTVVGVTPVPRQVERARRNIERRKLSHAVKVEQGDYTATNFPDASFDVVWALESVCHATNKAAFYRETARLLRPGGRLVVAEYMRARRPLAEGEEALLRGWIGGWMIPDLDTMAEHRQHSLEAGLSHPEIRDITPNVRRSLRRLYAMSLAGVPVSRVLRRLRLRGDVAHGNVMGSHLQYHALRQKLWAYGLLVARMPHAEPGGLDGSPGAAKGA